VTISKKEQKLSKNQSFQKDFNNVKKYLDVGLSSGSKMIWYIQGRNEV